ncbi:MAG: gamma-glutamyl-phosphate reductase, partial [Pirellulaceae bacterium]
MPVIKHFDGNCHAYIDRSADLAMGLKVVENAKCQRMGVCNALESLLVHRGVAEEFLPQLGLSLQKYPIEIRGCPATQRILEGVTPATEDDWKREYLGPILSVRIVDSVTEAIEHINRYGSHHTD